MLKRFLFIAIYFLTIILPLNLEKPCPLPNALGGNIILHTICQRQFLVYIVRHIPHLCQISVNCPQNAKNTACVKICLLSLSHRKSTCSQVQTSSHAVYCVPFAQPKQLKVLIFSKVMSGSRQLGPACLSVVDSTNWSVLLAAQKCEKHY
jgi:hypothetical protein